MGGLNPTVKEFEEKHPDRTILGMAWAYYWRLMVLVFVIETVVFIFFVLLAVLFGLVFMH